jgi:hypothetical protein
MTRESRNGRILSASGVTVLLAVGAALLPLRGAWTASGSASAGASEPQTQPQSEPWSSAQTLQPADFARELAASKSANKSTVVCVGFHTLFQGAHIPGASFHGPGNSAQGLDDLRKWAQPLPRSANLVVYCGCCPLWHCPNLRPAFVALRDMGFTHLRVLLLPNDLNSDWIERGYPIENGK